MASSKSRDSFIQDSNALAFGDRVMERRYQIFCITSCIDRIRPVLFNIYIPIVATMKLWSITHNVLHGPATELILESIRLSFLILLTILLSRKWGTASNYGRDIAILWIARIGSVLAFLQQLVDTKGGRDLQIFASLVGYVYTSGFVFYSFSEYILFVVPLAFLRPLYLSVIQKDRVSYFDVLYQHTLILALGVSITWTIHADYRRDWLRSRTAFARMHESGRPKVPKQAKHNTESNERATPSAAEKELGGASNLLWNGLVDGQISAQRADSPEMLEQAFQVRSQSTEIRCCSN